MASKITQLEIDTTAHMDEDGVGVCIYFGTNDSGTVETVFDFETLIENYFESYTIGDYIRPIDIPDVELLVIKLEKMALYARNMLIDITQDTIDEVNEAALTHAIATLNGEL